MLVSLDACVRTRPRAIQSVASARPWAIAGDWGNHHARVSVFRRREHYRNLQRGADRYGDLNQPVVVPRDPEDAAQGVSQSLRFGNRFASDRDHTAREIHCIRGG